jgi:uncharacterized protein YabN with tetrapyrrole methylase and pyrophosphatase domain
LGEVADILIRMEFGSRKGKMEVKAGKEKLEKKEIVDVIVPLIAIAQFYDIELEPVFKKNLNKILKDINELIKANKNCILIFTEFKRILFFILEFSSEEKLLTF